MMPTFAGYSMLLFHSSSNKIHLHFKKKKKIGFVLHLSGLVHQKSRFFYFFFIYDDLKYVDVKQ